MAAAGAAWPARHRSDLLRPARVLRRRPRGHAPARQRRSPPDPGLHRVHLHHDRRHPDIRPSRLRPGLAARRARPARHLGRRRLPAARYRRQAPGRPRRLYERIFFSLELRWIAVAIARQAQRPGQNDPTLAGYARGDGRAGDAGPQGACAGMPAGRGWSSRR